MSAGKMMKQFSPAVLQFQSDTECFCGPNNLLICALSIVSTNYAFSQGCFLLPLKNMNFTNQCVMLSGNTRNNPPPECANYTVLIKTITIIEHNYSDVNV